jgi:RNA-binding protein YhbY
MEKMDFQIGKNGITPEVIETLNVAFQTHKQIRISALKASGRDRNTINEMAEKIRSLLAFPTVSRIIGFKIILSRARTWKQADSK